ncbi:MAG: hypothetical protein AABW63_03395 [Nanoarchaeota archaeon]
MTENDSLPNPTIGLKVILAGADKFDYAPYVPGDIVAEKGQLAYDSIYKHIKETLKSNLKQVSFVSLNNKSRTLELKVTSQLGMDTSKLMSVLTRNGYTIIPQGGWKK